MVEAVEDWDADVAGRVVDSGVSFKERGVQIAEECMVLQACQAPVTRDLRLARELRFVRTLQAVTNHLVRAGALCRHVCETIVDTASLEHEADLQATLLEMSLGAHDIFREGLDVFAKRDVGRAQDLWVDDKVGLLYSQARNLFVDPSIIGNGGGSPEWRVRAALVVYYLEQIVDYGVDIGGRTVFLVTGELMGDTMRQYRERRLEDPGE